MSYLRDLRKAAGLHQAELADLAGTSQAQIGRLEKGERKLTIEWAERIAPHLNTTARNLMFPPDLAQLAPVVGFVGAGMEVFWERDGEPEFVVVPPGITVPVEVVTVRGDSMYPIYRNGDRLIFETVARKLEDVVGKECVVELSDGRKLVKTLRQVGNEIILESWNSPPITNVVIRMAYPIRWIERF
ncbi:XRE family transcriptional regulator [Aureimonas sp. D3]|uniref:XRE family transcriptional regulator n=1 Tax=Aureimonas sp. D3 TaxID=1638164 RepID=UPI00178CE5D1|nr:helix-turn-helix domain-containing protein [Aureimonas sp. D3]